MSRFLERVAARAAETLIRIGERTSREQDEFKAYTIASPDGEPYLTRLLLPRIRGVRYMIHHIHREDYDRHCHNHPWDHSTSIILSGGYTETRVEDFTRPRIQRRQRYAAGDRNKLDALDFHAIRNVGPDTYTLFIAGDRIQKWGFLVDDGTIVPHDEYDYIGTIVKIKPPEQRP